MKRVKMIQFFDLLDEKFIAEADPENAKNIKRKKTRSTVLRYGSIAACLLCTIGFIRLYQWLFVPISPMEQIVKTEYLRIGDLLAEYTVADTSRWQEWMLEKKIGEQISSGSIYRINNTNSLQYLIKDCGNDKYELLQFHSFFVNLAEMDEQYSSSVILRMQYDAGILTDDDLKQLRYHSTYTYGEVLESIYGVTSADEIEYIIWDKIEFDDTEVGKRVPVKKYVMKDPVSVKRFFDILTTMKRFQGDTDRPNRIDSDDEAYLNGEQPLFVQTERDVLIHLSDGTEIQFYYSPTDGYLYESINMKYEAIHPTDNEWLIETVDINMSWVNYGVNPATTNSPALETAAVSESAFEEFPAVE